MRRFIAAFIPGFAIMLTAGCASQPKYEHEVPAQKMNQYLADKPPAAKQHFRNVLVEGERNRVLNEMRSSLIAFELGDMDVAKRGFDSVLDAVETIYADNKSAKKARSKFRAEKNKEFKGEGYERAMAFYYRGLIYLAEGDYENARASFISAQLQDGFAENEKYASDFASMEWLAGWSSQCRALSAASSNSSRHLADEQFERALKINPNLGKPPQDARILIVAETGTSPKKVASSKGEEYLAYARGVPNASPAISWSGEKVVLKKAEDLYWQATTRGGRQVDVINAGKAEFKQSAADTAMTAASAADASMSAASVLLDAQLALGYSEDLMNATGVAALGGILGSLVSSASSAVSEATKPEADIRYWDNLPDMLHFGTLETRVIPALVEYELPSGKNGELALMSADNTCALGWLRTHSALSVPAIHVNAR